MNPRILVNTSLALALLFSAGTSIAADKAPAASSAVAPATKASDAKALSNKPAVEVKKKVKASPVAINKLVDINSANKASLMKIAGVSAADADKIIAGRPYLTKTRLVSKNIISAELYQAIKEKVIAKQADSEAVKTTATTPKKSS